MTYGENGNMKFNSMAKNLQIAIGEIVKNEELYSLLSNNNKTPLDSANIGQTNILNQNIFAEPFNMEVPNEQKIELRVFYPNGLFDGSNSIAVSDLYFQIVYHRDLERILIGNKPTLRSFEIMERIIQIFQDKSFSTLGNVLFKAFDYSHINKDYGMYTLVGEILTI